MTIFLLILLLLVSVQALRYRLAFKRAAADCESIMDDYQDLGREWCKETDRLEAALVRIVKDPDATLVIAYEARLALMETGTIKLMETYAPHRLLEIKRQTTEADQEFEAAIVELNRHRAASPIRYALGQRWWKLVMGVQCWWENPA